MSILSNFTRGVQTIVKVFKSSTSSNSTSPQTTTSNGSVVSGGGKVTQTTTTPPPSRSVNVTDYTTGESVTTYSSGGRVTGTSYSSSPSRVGNTTLGEERAIATSQQPNLLTARTTSPTVTQGNVLEPRSVNTESYNAYGASVTDSKTPPKTYQRPVTDAIGKSVKNVANVKTIGQYGFGTYFSNIFSPFEYVGTPEQEKPVGWTTDPRLVEAARVGGYEVIERKNPVEQYTSRPDWSGTPTRYYIGATKYEINQLATDLEYNKAGVNRQGEPAYLLPTVVQRDVVKDLRPNYQQQVTEYETERFNYYQGQVNKGNLTVNEAQTRLDTDVNKYVGEVNTQFSSAVNKEFSTRLSGSNYAAAQNYADSIARSTTESKLKVAATIGAGVATQGLYTSGSGGALAVWTASGVNLSAQGSKYAASFGNLSTDQRIKRGALVGASAIGFLATGYGATNKYYSELRQIQYNDLARAPQQSVGKTLITVRGDKGILSNTVESRVDTGTMIKTPTGWKASIGGDRATKISITQTTPTGSDRVGFVQKDVYVTRIFDAQTEKYIYTTTYPLSASGRVTGIVPDKDIRFVNVGSTKQGYDVGQGQAIVRTDKISFEDFIAASKKTSTGYLTVTGGTPSYRSEVNRLIIDRTNYQPKSISFQRDVYETYVNTARAPLTSYGTIDARDTFIVSPSQSTTGFPPPSNLNANVNPTSSGNVQQVQITSTVNTPAQRLVIEAPLQAPVSSYTNLETTTPQLYSVGSAVTTASTQGSQQLVRPTLIPPQVVNQREFQFTSARNIQTLQAVPSSSVTVPFLNTPSRTRSSSVTVSGVAQVQPPAQRTLVVPVITTGGALVNPRINRNPYSNTPPRIAGLPLFNLSPAGLGLTSNIVRGGQRRTGYTPSYQAIFFNIRGNAPKSQVETGINFRPITPNFEFKTGLQNPLRNLRGLLRK